MPRAFLKKRDWSSISSRISGGFPITEDLSPSSAGLISYRISVPCDGLSCIEAPSLSELKQCIQAKDVRILVLRPSPTEVEEILESLETLHRSQQVVLVSDQLHLAAIRNLINRRQLFKLVTDPRTVDWNSLLAEAQEEYELVTQNQQLMDMLNSQSQELEEFKNRLQRLSRERTEVEAITRQQKLKAAESLDQIQRALEGIYQALSVAEIRKSVVESLSPTLGISDVQIRSIVQHSEPSETRMPLSHEGQTLGEIEYTFTPNRKLTREEKETLEQINEVVTLSMVRLKALLESISIQREWEITFDALNIPVALISDNYEIIRCNEAFTTQSGLKPVEAQRRRCFEVLFGLDSPCEKCQLGSRFQIRQGPFSSSVRTFEVSSSLFSQQGPRRIFVNFYRDLTPLLEAERTILESVKSSELGIITSSIAHELTNPLAGMMTFLQLLQSDLPKEDSRRPLVDEMGAAAERCRHIIEELLDYSRRQDQNQVDWVQLREVLDRACSIVSLQSRSLGIQFNINCPPAAKVRGHRGALVQAFVGLFQAGIGSLVPLANQLNTADRHMDLTVQISERELKVELHAPRGGADLPLRPELAFTRRIVEDNNGRLEISAGTSIPLWARVVLPLPGP